MKKASLLIFTICIFTFSQAQVKTSLKAGVNVSSIKRRFMPNTGTRAGWYAGGLLQIPINQTFFIEPELLYSLKGESSNYQPASMRGNPLLSLNYITLPILLGYHSIKKLDFLIGPEVGYLIKAKWKYQSDVSNDVSDYFNKLDIGINFGISYNLSNKISTEVRYIYGFKGLYDDQQVKDGANRVLQIGVTCRFK